MTYTARPSPGKARLHRRIGVKRIEVVTFPPALATGGIERHFAGTGRSNSGEHVGTAASRAWCRYRHFRIAVAHASLSPRPRRLSLLTVSVYLCLLIYRLSCFCVQSTMKRSTSSFIFVRFLAHAALNWPCSSSGRSIVNRASFPPDFRVSVVVDFSVFTGFWFLCLRR